MALSCPRCSTPLERWERRAETRTIVLDRCRRCEGVWIDGAELSDVAPQLATVRESTADRSNSRIACVRCDAPAAEVPFFTVKIDVCPDCFGVWLDGPERIGLARELDAPTTNGTYRDAAVAVQQRMATCKQCHNRVPLQTTYTTGKGAICAACYRASQNTQPAAPRRAEHGAAYAAVDALGTIAAIASGTYCMRCGLRHCRH